MSNTIQNPIAAIREARGLTRLELAAALRVRVDDVNAVETGRHPKIPPRVIRGLAACGIDTQTINGQYAEWFEARAIAAGARLENAA